MHELLREIAVSRGVMNAPGMSASRKSKTADWVNMWCGSNDRNVATG